jgi:parallel beta-helix repeat protein
VDDVSCSVNGAACIVIGAPHVTLNLNGFSLTGQGDAQTGCSGISIGGEIGINVVNQKGVVILGPGLVQRFRNHGIQLNGGGGHRVTEVTASTNCMTGIFLLGGSADNQIDANVSVRNGHLVNPCGGICLATGAARNRIRGNRVSGNGYIAAGNNFGIGLVSANVTGNLFEENTAVGNANGIYLVAGVIGNIFRRNFLAGNPPVQVSVDHAANIGYDIKNLAEPGKNLFEDNYCLSAVNAPCPVVASGAASLLESQLQFAACGVYPPAASCRLNVHQWNWYLTTQIDPAAEGLIAGDNSQLMTARQYVRARIDAGLL